MEFAKPNPMSTACSLPESDTGVLPSSQMYLHLPSAFAKKALYYAPYVGHFFCTPAYAISRDNYDYYLLLLVDTGELQVQFNGQTFVAHARDIVFIDCKKPHVYRALTPLSFRYFHFEGSSSEAFYEILTERYGYLMHPAKQIAIESAMNTLVGLAYDGQLNEHKISAQIHIILSELAAQSASAYNPQDTVIAQAISYLEQHFTEVLTVEDLAEVVNLSPFYFSRLFRKFTNMSPHAYQVHLRVTLARQLLASTGQAVERIGEACGFNSTQHFIRSFKQHVGNTPREYRQRTLHTENT
ncbi:AraC family transcriptional regulator [Butyricicoccus sp. Marseille-Q5471]|uniref:AraC family transcriptional regulator n=1 Tax=Butyricicoccus sp. Marseille-Q5471 TaxID=3039493 RepID=UPI0024BC0245|nr:AraC family transcriptional regulator [Butyricicoccus sp. Marseille-Q5471]